MMKNIVQIKPLMLLITVSVFAAIQCIATDVAITDGQLSLISNGFEVGYDKICSLNFIFYLFIYIASANHIMVNEYLISIIKLPSEVYEYIKTHGTIFGLALFKLSSYSHLIQRQFNLFIKSHPVVPFHKSSAAIRSAVIAIP